MEARTVRRVLKDCLAHQEGEEVLVVAEPAGEPLARSFLREAVSLGVHPAFIALPGRETSDPEPPPVVAAALAAAPVVVLFSRSPFHRSRALSEACGRHGVRAACFDVLEPARVNALMQGDDARSGPLAALLRGATTVRVTTPAGTDLEFAPGGVDPHEGRITESGALGQLPWGRVAVTPRPGTLRGTAVIDGSATGEGRVATPFRVRFEDGRAVEIGSPRVHTLLGPLGPDAFRPSEIGFGTHPGAVLSGRGPEDRRAGGTLHLVLGTLPVPVTLVLSDVRVEADGKAVPPELLEPAPPAPAEPERQALPPIADETYRALFTNSNDPQVVMELDTQRFLEVNPSFERLSGYSRDELLRGDLIFTKLVARESYQTYLKKRETRRIKPSERYDIKLVTKSGEKRPVEMSVRLISHAGREMLLSSIRDLTLRKKLEQEMWSKIEDLGRASSRIYALTEKIRRVPEFTSQLLHITNEEELLERTAQLLCARDGVGYSDVTFHLMREEGLEMVYSTIRLKRRSLPLSGDHRLVRIVRGETPGVMTDQDALLPLKGRERNIGVMEVHFRPKEIEILRDNERALKGYRDLMETLSNQVGLLIENLHLYAKVHRQAIADPLTGVYNRRYLDTKLAEEVQRASRYSRDLTLVMIDVDHFAEINNSMGHAQGDLVLSEAAKIFRAQTREVDFVCRYGGDEFAIVMPETNYEHGLTKAENLRRVVREREFPNLVEPSSPVKLTLSIGVSAHRPDVRTADDLMKLADEAMYQAKQAGRDSVCGSYKDRNP